MKIIEAQNYQEMSAIAAEMIISSVTSNPSFTLGLATGGTPIGTYQELVRDYQTNKTSYSLVHTFNLDEYIGMDPTHPNSYHYYMNKHLFQHINFSKKNIHIPNGQATHMEEECVNYERQIKKHHGIDLQILGLGSNGHIGFNEPGTAFETKTHVVNLTESTRKANSRYFDSLNDVPRRAITMGIQTIMESKEIILLVSGQSKKQALHKLVHDPVHLSFPASILKKHEHVTIIADKEALKEIEQSA